MKKNVISVLLLALFSVQAIPQLKPGMIVPDFELISTQGDTVSLSDYPDSKAVIVVFISNICPFSRMYESRLLKMYKNFNSYGYPVLAINPQDEEYSPDESMDEMRRYRETCKFQFPYLKDYKGLYKVYGITRTPECLILKNESGGNFRLMYRGAIDDNVMDPEANPNVHIRQTLLAIQNGLTPDPELSDAIGCTIK